MDSIEPAPDSEIVYHVLEAEGGFLELGCQPSHVFHPTEEALDDIAHGIKVWIVCDWRSGIRLCRNDSKCAFFGDLSLDPLGRIGLVSNNGERITLPACVGIKHLAVME